MIKYLTPQINSTAPLVRLRIVAVIAALASMDLAIGQTPAPAATTTPATKEIVGDIQRGKIKVAVCIGCHGIPGYKADFPTVYSVPMLGGQNAKYIESALKAYQKGERRFPNMIATR